MNIYFNLTIKRHLLTRHLNNYCNKRFVLFLQRNCWTAKAVNWDVHSSLSSRSSRWVSLRLFLNATCSLLAPTSHMLSLSLKSLLYTHAHLCTHLYKVFITLSIQQYLNSLHILFSILVSHPIVSHIFYSSSSFSSPHSLSWFARVNICEATARPFSFAFYRHPFSFPSNECKKKTHFLLFCYYCYLI